MCLLSTNLSCSILDKILGLSWGKGISQAVSPICLLPSEEELAVWLVRA